MKLFNIFKKESSKNSSHSNTTKSVTIQKLEKNQLEKVIGGGDDQPIETASHTSKRKNGSVIACD